MVWRGGFGKGRLVMNITGFKATVGLYGVCGVIGEFTEFFEVISFLSNSYDLHKNVN